MDRLGIIDWGIGGVSIYKLVREQLGHVPVTYLSDTGATPYGRMSRTQLVTRLDAVVEYLISEKGVSHLVIGCNAASTAVPFLAEHGIPVLGVIEPAIELAVRQKPRKLGVIGGRRTVLSGVYRRGFAARGIRVDQRIAQPLSAMIEAGDTSSPALRDAADQIISPLRSCSHILLACTHYPAITPILESFLTDTVLINPAAELIGSIKQWNVTPGGSTEFVTTGDPKAMRTAARSAFGIEIPKPVRIDL